MITEAAVKTNTCTDDIILVFLSEEYLRYIIHHITKVFSLLYFSIVLSLYENFNF